MTFARAARLRLGRVRGRARAAVHDGAGLVQHHPRRGGPPDPGEAPAAGDRGAARARGRGGRAARSRRAQERNAWQEDGADRPHHPVRPARHRALGVAAAFWRAERRRLRRPRARSGWPRSSPPARPRCSCSTGSSRSRASTTMTVVKVGAPLALGVLGRDRASRARRLSREEAARRHMTHRARHRAHGGVHGRGQSAHRTLRGTAAGEGASRLPG